MIHIACAWGQRFHGVVTFPVGFNERIIVAPTVPGDTCCYRVWPLSAEQGMLTFDMIIYDQAGTLRELIRGVRMKDVTGGLVKPPLWVQTDTADPLPTLRSQCDALSVIENIALFGFAEKSLSPIEADRLRPMGNRRRKGYLAGRIALKSVARKIADHDQVTPAQTIHTMMHDQRRPLCPHPTEGTPFPCSLSHNRRFAVAVADNEPCGVDVETLSDRVLKAGRLFMNEKELSLVEESSLGTLAASLRIWSIKEGAAKIGNLSLAESWERTNVYDIGLNESRLTVAGEQFAAFHDTIDEHVFTLVKRRP